MRKSRAIDIQSSDVERIAGELRASLRKVQTTRADTSPDRIARALCLPAASGVSAPERPIEHELALLHSNYEIASTPFTSHRRVLGRFIVFIKNIARELMDQVLARQSLYNGAATRAITQLKHRLDQVAEDQSRIAQRVAVLESRIGAVQPLSVSLATQASSGSSGVDRIKSDPLYDRLHALEDALEERPRDARNRA